MNSGLFWTVLGSVAGVLAAGVAVWQILIQVQERREQSQVVSAGGQSPDGQVGGLPVTPPFGRLPIQVRGRDELLAEFGSALTKRSQPSGRTWVLAGMGGVGKSTVALAAAKMAKSSGWRVWWVTASDIASLSGGISEILQQLRAPDSVVKPVREGLPTAPTRTWDFLNGPHSGGHRWLLVFDNVDIPAVLAAAGSSPADYTGWLRPDPSGILIVTTRSRDARVWGHQVKLRILQPLNDAAGAQILTDLAPDIADPTRRQAFELGLRLGGLPLAMHLAGTYLASPFARWDSFAGYRLALESKGFPLALADVDELSSQTRDTIQGTWDLSLEGLDADGRPQARKLLLLLSCYAPVAQIPISLFEQPDGLSVIVHYLKSSIGEELKGYKDEGRLIREGLSGLAEVGLIDLNSGVSRRGTAAITVHPVIADANRARLLSLHNPDLHSTSHLAIGLLRVASGKLDPALPADWPEWDRLIPHISALLEWMAAYLDKATLVDLINIGSRSADAMWRSSNLAISENLARRSLAAAKSLGNDSPAGSPALSGIGVLGSRRGVSVESGRAGLR